ncbi:type I-F CRISPR-associated protein Csy3 [Methylicorpusculum oleiharenae]|uniref:type I-F CRISPR-associated protein Csy3 n=1 Tax=Methylicorpusculum oleiharenae TaxID=1338687 RepID=UPI001356C3F9|nr:type I-F CRISPR-associated protein Csy3 [Methylicorpusculum oleiharenae]MCD2453228.1 type I-F CRISPR-associated protein Csy3 [Methylicorpusculum oleiharenae]
MAEKTTKSTVLSLPSVLAFSRKLEVSDALMASGLWSDIDKSDKWQPIALHEKRNRATHSQFGAKDDDKSKPNLSWGDDATLPHDVDTLRVKFTLKVLGQLEEPTACNTPAFEEKVTDIVAAYRIEHEFKELALRYANNIVNGRFLWRNRVGAESISIEIKHGERRWLFDAYDYLLNQFRALPDESNHPFAQLVSTIQSGLQGDGFEYLEITAFSKLGSGQHVFPSQEMVMNPPKDQKTKFLFQLNGCAGMHSEKIGNALRTIDTWYTDDCNVKAIAIEPYGSVTSRGEAYRISKNDFYTLFIKWLKEGEIPAEQQHYVIATLIRGGVFGGNE